MSGNISFFLNSIYNYYMNNAQVFNYPGTSRIIVNIILKIPRLKSKGGIQKNHPDRAYQRHRKSNCILKKLLIRPSNFRNFLFYPLQNLSFPPVYFLLLPGNQKTHIYETVNDSYNLHHACLIYF